MPKISQEALEERRAEIVQAARRVFASKGLSKATLRDVFREAGLSAGAVYNYFQSKDDLILAVTEAGMADALTAVTGTSSRAPDVGAVVARFLESLVVMDATDVPRVDLMIAAEAMANLAVHRAVVSNRERIRAALVRLVEHHQRTHPDRAALPAHTLAEMLYAMYQGLIVSVALGEKPDVTGIRAALKALFAT